MMSPAEREEFIDQIAAAVANRLAARPRLLDRYALAEVLGVSVPSIERLQAAGQIPVVRIGRRCLYDPDNVVHALTARDSPIAPASSPSTGYRVMQTSQTCGGQ
jgi:hypothetical protein